MKLDNDRNNNGDHALTITRIFDAPRELVFAAWTQPQHMLHWWGPRGYTTLSSKLELFPGGNWRVTSRHEDGGETTESGVIRECDAPARLVLTHAWENKDGTRGLDTVVTLSFTEQDGRTTMVFHQAPFDSTDTRDGHGFGWSESFDMLAEYLAEN
jgi:uncharacterized protein YndB with AHSA1/START domain